jgi:hypothetical protein
MRGADLNPVPDKVITLSNGGPTGVYRQRHASAQRTPACAMVVCCMSITTADGDG